MTTVFLLIIGIVILLCIGLNNISARIGLPTLLLFLLLGMIFGNSGINKLELEDYNFAKETCTVALIFIMFYGGFGTRWATAKPVVGEASLLASVGVVTTAALTGLFCHFALGWSWVEGLLLGSVVGSTDAASVFSILRSKKLGLKNNTAPLLEMESGSNDPFSYMLTIVMLGILDGSATGGSIAIKLVAQIVFGLGCGFGIAKLAELVLDHFHIMGKGFDSLFILSIALLSYAVPDIIGGNGYLSAYIVGIILGNREFAGKKALVNFFDGVTGLMQVLIFFLLGMLARVNMLHRVVLPALAIFAFMLLVARPVAVMSILTPFRKYPFRQQALVSFVGLRGAASIVFAILAVTDNPLLEVDLFNVVFCLVLISISMQGSLIPWVAKKLDMTDASTDVMKTFNDYSEATEIQFGRVDIIPGSTWDGKYVRELRLPKNMLLAMVLRDGRRYIPTGSMKLHTGDEAVVVTRPFGDSETYLVEKTVKKGGKRAGRKLNEVSGEGLVLLVKRNDQEFIPNGDTVLCEGDILVLLREKEAKGVVPYDEKAEKDKAKSTEATN